MQNEKKFLSQYDATLYARPNCTVDVIIFTIINDGLHVLTIKRKAHPFQNMWSLVGGFIDVDSDKTLEDTARRKLQEKTGVATPYLEQLCTVGNKTRDPRGWTVTNVYFALIPSGDLNLCLGEGVADIRWAKIVENGLAKKLAFDHNSLLTQCLRRLRDKVLYTSLPVHLMPATFTLGELQKVYEIILGSPIPHKSFRRRIMTANILEETGDMKHQSKRPATIYRLKDALSTHYFMRNLEGVSR